MKKIILPFIIMALFSFITVDSPLTEVEREFAVKEMKGSKARMMVLIDELSEEQLNFKVSENSWSIAECVEHLAISEENIFGMLKGTLGNDPDPSKRSEVKISDKDLLIMIKDRANKVQTSKAFEPSGKYGSFEATVEAFNSKRKSNMEYVLETQDDLRNRYVQLPFGTIDSYQILLFMSGHTDRHVQQMEEVMADSGFPTE